VNASGTVGQGRGAQQRRIARQLMLHQGVGDRNQHLQAEPPAASAWRIARHVRSKVRWKQASTRSSLVSLYGRTPPFETLSLAEIRSPTRRGALVVDQLGGSAQEQLGRNRAVRASGSTRSIGSPSGSAWPGAIIRQQHPFHALATRP